MCFFSVRQGRRAGATLPPFLSTHPLTTDRVKLLEKDLPEAYKLYDESGMLVLSAANVGKVHCRTLRQLHFSVFHCAVEQKVIFHRS